jgi:hypothetical protein
MARINESNGRFEARDSGAVFEIEHDQESNYLCLWGQNYVYLDKAQAGRLYDWLKKNPRRMNTYKKVRDRNR